MNEKAIKITAEEIKALGFKKEFPEEDDRNYFTWNLYPEYHPFLKDPLVVIADNAVSLYAKVYVTDLPPTPGERELIFCAPDTTYYVGKLLKWLTVDDTL